MPVPLPRPEVTLLEPPSAAESLLLSRGIASAVRSNGRLTELQEVLIAAISDALTGHTADLSQPPITSMEFAHGLARRDAIFRTRILQVMLLCALVLRPLPEDVVTQVNQFAVDLSVDDGMLAVLQRYGAGDYGLAGVDFERNGYTAGWSSEQHAALHTTSALKDAWALAVDDAPLAARWKALEDLPEGTFGRSITEFYRARGFHYPGTPGSAPPLLAQHDWVHLIADYGSTVECELEVFAFIARANDDPKGFSLLAMVVSLFETGYLTKGAGLFEALPGQVSKEGMAVRIADAMRRGALVDGSIDFMDIDFFELAPHTLDEVRARFGVTPKSDAALAAGSVGPWEQGGISEFQLAAGTTMAIEQGRPYDPFGASV